MPYYFTFELADRTRFYHKLLLLLTATILLVPLLYYKMIIPSAIYLMTLLILHLFFVLIYFHHTPWKTWFIHPTELVGRLAAVAFFAILLASIKFTGAPIRLIFAVITTTLIHAAILLALILKVKKP